MAIIDEELQQLISRLKFNPIKKLYYNKFQHRILIRIPEKPSGSVVNHTKTAKKPVLTLEQIQSDTVENLVELVFKNKKKPKSLKGLQTYEKERKKLRDKIQKYKNEVDFYNCFIKEEDEFMKRYATPYEYKNRYKSYATYKNFFPIIKNLKYRNSITLYINNDEQFGYIVKKFYNYILTGDTLMNDKHSEVLSNQEIFIERHVRKNLFNYRYKFKVIFKCSSNELKNLINSLGGVFDLSNKEKYCLTKNFYSLSFLFNDYSELLPLKLMLPNNGSKNNVKFYEAILSKEISGEE